MSHRLLFPLFIFLCVGQNSLVAEDFRIESTPPGATVEIEGKVVGTTPYTWTKLPGGYSTKRVRCSVLVWSDRCMHGLFCLAGSRRILN